MAENSNHRSEVFFNSLGDGDVFIDEPGDTTIRPCRPEHLAHANAERAKILMWLKAGFRPYAETEERAEAQRLQLITEYEAAIAREAAGQA